MYPLGFAESSDRRKKRAGRARRPARPVRSASVLLGRLLLLGRVRQGGLRRGQAAAVPLRRERP